jgi:hypothetical protein
LAEVREVKKPYEFINKSQILAGFSQNPQRLCLLTPAPFGFVSFLAVVVGQHGGGWMEG